MNLPTEYAKFNDLLLAKELLPHVFPFYDLRIVQNLKDWEQIADRYGDFVYCRVDAPIGYPRPRAATSGNKSDIPRLIKQYCNPFTRCAVIIMTPKDPNSPPVKRYNYDGGFSVLFELDKHIVVEAVSRGFDGGDITHGAIAHERWIYPWDNLTNDNDLKWFQNRAKQPIYFINNQDYRDTREARIDLLVKECRFEYQTVAAAIPRAYERLPYRTIQNLVGSVALALRRRQTYLRRNNLTNFIAYGNIVSEQPQVWGIYRQNHF